MKKFAYALAICVSAGSLLASEPNQQIAADPNGQHRQPTIAEQQELIALAAARVAAPKVVRTHANGMMSIAIDETHDHHFIAMINDEGQLMLTCTDDHVAITAMTVSANNKTDSIMRIKPLGKRAAERQ